MKIALICFVLFLASETAHSDSDLSLAEARRIVEEYVLKQGYTDAPVSLTPDELDGSSFERSSRSEWLASRRGMISASAVAYTNQVRGEIPGWTFGFRYKLPAKASEYMKRYANEHYFSVQVTQSGKNILVLHSPLYRTTFQQFRDK